MVNLSGNKIRKLWLDFFKKNDHMEYQSQSLIPINDKSLLWINSGVATLKDFFCGIKTPPKNRITSSQRCIRTNDIFNVGVTARHHTFFEMLGNFSIGDYFKNEAIEFGFEFLTKELKIDLKKLYITVYEEDKDAYNKWIELGIIKSHIIKCNKDRNFWDVGEGPCGPCTEIYYDRGEKYDKDKIGEKLFFDDIENDRYVEIWNIVFSQFNNDGKNNYTELSRKNIDTGAGLERITCISQDAPTNFESDLFMPIINEIKKLTDLNYDVNSYFTKDKDYKQFEINKCYRVIADHIKACTFAIADGGQPSNKERGSIIRKLIRRSMVCGKKLNIKGHFLEKVSNAVIDVMKEYYPYLIERKNDIFAILKKEETLFNNTLENGYKLFENLTNKSSTYVDTQSIFKLVETYGFPYEIIEEQCNEKNLKIKKDEYDKLFKEHQEISRANLDVKGMATQNSELINFTHDSQFNYDVLSMKDCKIIGLFDKEFNKKNNLIGEGWIVFDKHPIYATSGGQIHDIGKISLKQDEFDIVDAIKGPNGQHFILTDTDGIKLSIGDKCNVSVDKTYRDNVSKNHSAEHLLEHVMHKHISNTIKQMGAFKSPDRFTFDFPCNTKLTDDQIKLVQDKVNEIINKGGKVNTTITTIEEAKKNGAVAHFDEVYTKIKGGLRLVTMNALNEICGGTHVKDLKDIEQFFITKLSNNGGGIWRIEAITSKKTINSYLEKQTEVLVDKLDFMKKQFIELKINNKDFLSKLNSVNYKLTIDNFFKLKNEFELLKNEFNEIIIKEQKKQNELDVAKIKVEGRKTNKNKTIELGVYHNRNGKNILAALNELTNEFCNITFVGINISDEKLEYYIVKGKNGKVNANDLIKGINNVVDGKGGGSPLSAQGGTSKVKEVDNLVDYVINYTN